MKLAWTYACLRLGRAKLRAPVRERKREKVAVTDLDRAEAKRVMRKVGRHVRE